MKSVLELKNVKKKIGRKEIIKGISLDVQPGEVFGFLGPNGAGKTTTIRMIVGLIGITDGDIIVDGNSVRNNHGEALKKIGAIVENPEFYKFMSGYDNLKQYARMYQGITKEKIEEVVEFVGLTKSIHQKVKTYSLGMRQRLGLAQCLLHDPKLLILDEPTNGLDPAGIREIRDHLKKLTKEKGMAVLVSSHLLSEMEMMCDRFAILQHGEIIEVQSVHETQTEENASTYLLEVGNVASIQNWIERTEGISLEGKLVKVEKPKQELPDIIKVLVEMDVDIYTVIPQSKTLEERFLEKTAAQGGY
ncbi:ABC transporter ATP-binding protein [Mangrovibacillus cuniculi]|uniref:ABC transporter ATP-binding protein n=1 Tax=Mangrovibacillus cuniculi TaxID=2593652 RepID=A0A7S8HFN0_9BACI|nr:ABC transporter ATP-binding protein [Mangrovibacillus cuniculi]QPC47003.1 ABC transporter ATP-binding protein [Mangrovibacillus cuniculi]